MKLQRIANIETSHVAHNHALFQMHQYLDPFLTVQAQLAMWSTCSYFTQIRLMTIMSAKVTIPHTTTIDCIQKRTGRILQMIHCLEFTVHPFLGSQIQYDIILPHFANAPVEYLIAPMLPKICLLESFTRIKQLCVDTKCKEPFVMYTDEERFLQHAEQLQLHKNLETLNLDCRMINSMDWIHQLTLLRHLDLTGTNLADLPTSLTLLENLEALYLSYAQEIEDFDLVGTLVWLRELRLDNTQVDDLQFIKGMKKLEKLCVWYTSVSDLFPIAHLTKLKSLDIGDTQVTSLEPLEGLTGLVKLDITKNRVHHLNSLSKLENLEVLILNETNFDGDLKVLSQLKNLKTLSVANTSVNDLSPLAGLSKLNALNILGTDVQSFSPLQSLEFLDKLCFENEKVNGCELLKCWPFEPISQSGNNYKLFVMHHD